MNRTGGRCVDGRQLRQLKGWGRGYMDGAFTGEMLTEWNERVGRKKEEGGNSSRQREYLYMNAITLVGTQFGIQFWDCIWDSSLGLSLVRK